MPSCVLCPSGSCPSDCPALDLFPSDKEESMVLAEKAMMAVGFKSEFMKECLRAVTVSGGGLDVQKDFISMLIGGHEGGQYLAKQRKVLAKIKKDNAEAKRLKEAINAEHKSYEKLVKSLADVAFRRPATTRKSRMGDELFPNIAKRQKCV